MRHVTGNLRRFNCVYVYVASDYAPLMSLKSAVLVSRSPYTSSQSIQRNIIKRFGYDLLCYKKRVSAQESYVRLLHIKDMRDNYSTNRGDNFCQGVRLQCNMSCFGINLIKTNIQTCTLVLARSIVDGTTCV